MTTNNAATEVNFDAIVGPTHNYAGLSYGNVASIQNTRIISRPKLAAKQGLQKMRMVMDLGVPQAVLPPHQRPNFGLLRKMGFHGTETQMLQQAYQFDPRLLAAVYSAASMWTANMATVSPSCDTQDHKLHITPANLSFHLHRAQEAEFSHKLLQTIFANQQHFVVHPPLLGYRDLSDEGGANHSVLCKQYGEAGIELFVYGRHGLDDLALQPVKFPARQTMLASGSLMRNHLVDPGRSFLIQQNPLAIDSGVFHNDVVFVANKNVLFFHAQAFIHWPVVQNKIQEFFSGDCDFVAINQEHLSLEEAVSTYMFNSQLVSTAADAMTLIAPMECKENANASAVLEAIVSYDNPIKQVIYVDCRQSMLNGGGPACLRLRVVLTPQQSQALSGKIMLTPDLYQQIDAWIDRHYRDEIIPNDLLDPNLYTEVQTALDQLTQILNLGSIYPFQS